LKSTCRTNREKKHRINPKADKIKSWSWLIHRPIKQGNQPMISSVFLWKKIQWKK
jgi:hypothetical protein